MWAKRAGGTASDYGYGIAALSDNSTVVTGSFGWSATFGEGESNQTILNSAGSEDIFLARYNQDGTLAWSKPAGGSSADCGLGITVLSDDSIVMTGRFKESATFSLGEPSESELISAGNNDIFIARYSPDGLLTWVKSAGGAGADRGHGITALTDNSTVVAGCFNGAATFGAGEPNGTFLISFGYFDIFIARFAP
jgi:hypothetical protein